MTKLHYKFHRRTAKVESSNSHQINKRMSKQFALVPLAQKYFIRSFVRLLGCCCLFFFVPLFSNSSFNLPYAYRSNAESYTSYYIIIWLNILNIINMVVQFRHVISVGSVFILTLWLSYGYRKDPANVIINIYHDENPEYEWKLKKKTIFLHFDHRLISFRRVPWLLDTIC